MVIEVFENFFAFSLLCIADLYVPLLELLVLSAVLAGDLLVLLSDDVCLGAPVLELKRLLVVKLLFDLSFDCSGIDLSQQRYEPVDDQFIESICALLKRQIGSLPCAVLKLTYTAHKLPMFVQKYG